MGRGWNPPPLVRRKGGVASNRMSVRLMRTMPVGSVARATDPHPGKDLR